LTPVGLGKRFIGSETGRNIIGFVAAQYVRLVNWTTKWQVVNGQFLHDSLANGQGIISITWHSRLMMVPIAWPGPKPLHLLVSRHRDGEMIARAMSHFGMIMIRGSTRRAGRDRDKGGSAALRQMLGLLQAGHSIGLTPDGPRGPAMHLSEGVITLARLSGAPIIPVTVCTRRHHAFDSWDKFRFALPFSRGVMVFGAPITIDREIDEQAKEASRHQVETALCAVTEQADRLLGTVP
jgi:hypothetical protein